MIVGRKIEVGSSKMHSKSEKGEKISVGKAKAK